MPSNPNPLKRLQDFGQSVYVDEIRRSWFSSGYLDTLIERDGLRGLTSNPAIFEKAIAQSDDYDAAIADLAGRGMSVESVFESLAVDDIQRAADALRGVYDDSDGRYGYVSLEVSPELARDTEGTLAEARRLWAAVDRPNLFIKVPGTREGVPAIKQLLVEGINVNVTLLFSLERYRDVATAYLEALEARHAAGEPIARIASVASFFLSRIDVMVDTELDRIAEQGGRVAELAGSIRGQIAIANAKMAYQIYRELFESDRFDALASAGARSQRLLWASTSTKDPSFEDVKYVEALIGPDTINTLPTDTLDAYRDHGDPAVRIEDDLGQAEAALAALSELDIDIDEVTDALEQEGIEKFETPFRSLMETLEEAVGRAAATQASS